MEVVVSLYGSDELESGIPVSKIFEFNSCSIPGPVGDVMYRNFSGVLSEHRE